MKLMIIQCAMLGLILPMVIQASTSGTPALERWKLYNEDGKTTLHVNFTGGANIDEVIESSMPIVRETFEALGTRIDETVIYVDGNIYKTEVENPVSEVTTVSPATQGFQTNAFIATTTQTTAQVTATSPELQHPTPGDPPGDPTTTDSVGAELRSGGESARHPGAILRIVMPVIAGLLSLQLFM